MGLLQELDCQGEQFGLGERQMYPRMAISSSRPGKPSVSVGWRREDVVGDLVGRFVFVHRHADAKSGWAGMVIPATTLSDVAAVVKQRGQAGPRLLVHPIALIEHADAADKHGRTMADAW